jgi:hypothetical protein
LKDKNRAKFRLMPVGEKASIALARPFPDIMKSSISETGTPTNFPTVMGIAE